MKLPCDILDKKFVDVLEEGLTETDEILVEGLRKVHDGDVISPRFGRCKRSSPWP